MQLKTEIDTPFMGDQVEDAASDSDLFCCDEQSFKSVFEHGQWWVSCANCGAQWSANDADTKTGFDFEQVTRGDED